MTAGKIIDEISDEDKLIHVFGARVHNLKNIDVAIPRNKLVVITGLSGSGKSSLAFDTIYAEGQRRYIETFSAYARQFLGSMERPDVDNITGLSPVISIEQKTTNKNPRSTVGTITEIYDFLRLLYARASEAYSYVTGEKMVRYTSDQVINLVVEKFNSQRVFILAPIIKGRKGHYKDLFEQLRKRGFPRVRIDGEIKELVNVQKLDRYKTHNIELVVDMLTISGENRKRIKESIQTAMKYGKGTLIIWEPDHDQAHYFSSRLMCPVSGISYDEPAPHSFSFNSPAGACPQCNGLGNINEFDLVKIIPDKKLSIANGGIAPLGKQKSSLLFWQLDAIATKYHFTLNTPIEDIPEQAMSIILYGSDEVFRLHNTPLGTSNYFLSFDGVVKFIVNNQNDKTANPAVMKWANQFITSKTCPECNGSRLKKEALFFKFAGMNIAEMSGMDIRELSVMLENIESSLSEKQRAISKEILKEIRTRLKFLVDVGLDYISLGRSAQSLSGGESQRIRLATQIGSQLVNVLYILDEPSIGLHQKDNLRLIKALQDLRDSGNSVIVVEHDKEMILSADYVIDMGPLAGKHGGGIVACGAPKEIVKTHTLTASYLNGLKKIEIPEKRRKGSGKNLIIKGARGNNLKNVSVAFPIGKFICITGVSGSGKSSLVNETLHPVLSRHFYRSIRQPLDYDSIAGMDMIDKVIEVNQSPIGRTPRSNPVTYTGVFTDIRKLFEVLPESKIRGYKAGRFSFNVKGGRCEGCQGAGVKTLEMNFLPDVFVKCDECGGKRYNRETLDVRFKGKSISDVLNMTVDLAVEFFSGIPSILNHFKAMQQVGLGYITLGQQATTLSGGESQRIKLAAELSKRDTGNTLYILDEPTTGLHFEDIRVLLDVLNKLVDRGNTIIVIEHNMEVIKVADHIIDMGPGGGAKGGEIICTGTPEEVAKMKLGFTSGFLEKELNLHRREAVMI